MTKLSGWLRHWLFGKNLTAGSQSENCFQEVNGTKWQDASCIVFPQVFLKKVNHNDFVALHSTGKYSGAGCIKT